MLPSSHSWEPPVNPGRFKVYHRDDIYDRATFFRTELGADWCRPHKLFDPLALDLELGGQFPAALHFYHDRETGRPFGERGLPLLRLLLPAFKAGVRTHQRLFTHRAELSRLIDRVSTALSVHDCRGVLLHENPALTRVLAEDPECTRLRNALRTAAASAAALAHARERAPRAEGGGIAPRMNGSAHRRGADAGIAHVPAVAGSATAQRFRTGAASYHVDATLLGPGQLAADALVVVALERLASRPATDAELIARYGLTTREVQVSRLLARGMSTKELARAGDECAHSTPSHGARAREARRAFARRRSSSASGRLSTPKGPDKGLT